MASLVYESQLNAILEDLIKEAEEQLFFYCPYFRLHDRLKDCLKLRKNDHNLRIAIVFGKNEEDPSKSLSKEDFEFLRCFPNIVIAYEKRLHAKYFANEKYGLITSLNLHTYSQNNNIEVGVLFKTKNALKALSDRTLGAITSIVSDTEDLGAEAAAFFSGVFNNADVVFENEPQFESKLLGLQKKYISSKVLVDNTNKIFSPYKQTAPNNSGTYYKSRNTTQNTTVKYNHDKAFCIRTGSSIPFNPMKPLSRDAYQSWAQYSNLDFAEKFCHGCGINWRTSMRHPFCTDCVNALES